MYSEKHVKILKADGTAKFINAIESTYDFNRKWKPKAPEGDANRFVDNLSKKGYMIFYPPTDQPPTDGHRDNTKRKRTLTTCNVEIESPRDAMHMIQASSRNDVEFLNMRNVQEYVKCIPLGSTQDKDFKQQQWDESYNNWTTRNTLSKKMTNNMIKLHIIANPTLVYSDYKIKPIINVDVLNSSHLAGGTMKDAQKLWSNMFTTLKLEQGSLLYMDANLLYNINITYSMEEWGGELSPPPHCIALEATTITSIPNSSDKDNNTVINSDSQEFDARISKSRYKS